MSCLKRTYTITVDEELAKRIEEYKEEERRSYTEIFIEAIKNLLGVME